jgi:conjugal transfer pilus assembly protein TraK
MAKKILLSAALAFAMLDASALQIVEPVEGQNSFVKISAKETTRIYIDGGQLVTLYHTEGELVLEKDDERGQIFIRPVILDKPINVRLLSGSGVTYNLVMQAVDIPQEDIAIREPFDMRTDRNAGNTKSYSGNLIRAVRSMMSAMASDEPPSAVDMRETRQELALWENTRFVMVGVFNERELVGEKFVLTNTGSAVIRMVEQELYRNGVVAISIENMELAPGQSTFVYIVRAK